MECVPSIVDTFLLKARQCPRKRGNCGELPERVVVRLVLQGVSFSDRGLSVCTEWLCKVCRRYSRMGVADENAGAVESRSWNVQPS